MGKIVAQLLDFCEPVAGLCLAARERNRLADDVRLIAKLGEEEIIYKAIIPSGLLYLLAQSIPASLT